MNFSRKSAALEVVKLLVGLGEDVNAVDSYGITPLMVRLGRQGSGPRSEVNKESDL